MVTAGGSAPHMQTITYSQQMQYATLASSSAKTTISITVR